MNMKFATVLMVSTALAMAPLAPASAHIGHGRGHGDGPILGLFALGAAVVAGTVAVASMPFNAVAEAAPGPQGYYPQQQAYPQQAYAPQYAQAPVYAPPAYYPAPQVYYAPPAYYPPQVYYRRYN